MKTLRRENRLGGSTVRKVERIISERRREDVLLANQPSFADLVKQNMRAARGRDEGVQTTWDPAVR